MTVASMNRGVEASLGAIDLLLRKAEKLLKTSMVSICLFNACLPFATSEDMGDYIAIFQNSELAV